MAPVVVPSIMAALADLRKPSAIAENKGQLGVFQTAAGTWSRTDPLHFMAWLSGSGRRTTSIGHDLDVRRECASACAFQGFRTGRRTDPADQRR